jgi:hypothetical protein
MRPARTPNNILLGSGGSGGSRVSGMVYLIEVAPFSNGMQKTKMLLLQNVFEGTTHQVPHMATFGDRQLGARVTKSTGGPLPTQPGPYNLKLLRDLIMN